MAPTESNRKWNRRPGAIMEEALRLAVALGVMSIGLVLFFAERSGRILWLPLWAIAAIVTWLLVPKLLRTLSDAGWFGRVRLKDGRLYAGRNRFLDLDRPMTVEARFQRATLRHTFNLSHVSSNLPWAQRTSTKPIVMMSVVIHQEQRTMVLAADAAGHRLEGPLDLEGLNLRRVALSQHPAPVTARLWPRDLTDILRRLQSAPGYRTTQTPVPDRSPEDPRRSVWPLAKMASGLMAVLLLWMCVVTGTFVYFRNLHRAQYAREVAEARAEEALKEEMARSTYLGKRVTAPIRKWRIEGRVADVVMVDQVRFEPKRVEFRGPKLMVTVEAMYGENGELLPPDAEIYFRHVEDLVRVGSRVELDPEKARLTDEEGEE